MIYKALHPHHEAGFSMIEVLVSASLFAVSCASMLPFFSSRMKSNTWTEVKTGAIAAAQRKLDELRLSDPAALPGSSSSQYVGAAETYTIDNRPFRVSVTYCPTGTAYCTSANSRHLRVDVTYRSTRYYRVETVFTQLQ